MQPKIIKFNFKKERNLVRNFQSSPYRELGSYTVERLQTFGIWLETQYLSLGQSHGFFPPSCDLSASGTSKEEDHFPTPDCDEQTFLLCFNIHFPQSTQLGKQENTMCAVIPVWMLELPSKNGELWKLSLSRKDKWLGGGEKTDF